MYYYLTRTSVYILILSIVVTAQSAEKSYQADACDEEICIISAHKLGFVDPKLLAKDYYHKRFGKSASHSLASSTSSSEAMKEEIEYESDEESLYELLSKSTIS